MTLQLAARTMASRQDFSRVLKQQRMSFRQFIDAHPGNFRLQIQGNASKLYALPAATARIKQRADGTLLQFERLRPMRAEGAAAQSAVRE